VAQLSSIYLVRKLARAGLAYTEHYIQYSASTPEISFSAYSLKRNQILIDAEEYFDSM